MEQEIKLLKTRVALLQKLLNVQKNIQREIGNFGYKIYDDIVMEYEKDTIHITRSEWNKFVKFFEKTHPFTGNLEFLTPEMKNLLTEQRYLEELYNVAS